MERTTLVLDTNVLLHGKALVAIDWLAKAQANDVVLVIPWRVLGELEQHASDDSQPGRKRRAIDRRNTIRDRRRSPIPFGSPRIAIEIGAGAPDNNHSLVDDAVLDEVRLRARHGRAALVTRDVMLSERAETAGLEVLTLTADEEEPISYDPSLAKRLTDVEADVRRLEKHVDALLATRPKSAKLRLTSHDSNVLRWRVAWTYATPQANDPVGVRMDRTNFSFRLRIHNDGDGAASGVEVSITVPRQHMITIDGSHVAALLNRDPLSEFGRRIAAIGPDSSQIDELGGGRHRLRYDPVTVHARGYTDLPQTWVGILPEMKPVLELPVRMSSMETPPQESVLTFDVEPMMMTATNG